MDDADGTTPGKPAAASRPTGRGPDDAGPSPPRIEGGEAVPLRPEARASAPVGSAHGIHLPGIFPEPEVIEPEDEMSDSERAVLEDLQDTQPEDVDAGDEEPAQAADAQPARPVELPRERAQMPWWYAVWAFVPGGLILLGIAAMALLDGSPPLAGALGLGGLACLWVAARAFGQRKRSPA